MISRVTNKTGNLEKRLEATERENCDSATNIN